VRSISLPHLRTTKTKSGAIAVQAIRYVQRKSVILKHFGSAHTPHDLAGLIQNGETWLARNFGQSALPLQRLKSSSRLVNLEHLEYQGIRYTFAYDLLMHVFRILGFTRLQNTVCLNLALMRLLEPSSKLRAIELLRRYFGIIHGQRTVYEAVPRFLRSKDAVERLLVAHAGRNAPPSLILYDVTTLYFESEKDETLRRHGFSKDHRPDQPQIVVGLLVDRSGFPLGYDIFPGNTFEGHTMLRVVERFRRTHHIDTCVVVADAAMLSLENLGRLRERCLFYIVGARLSNLPSSMTDRITRALDGHKDGQTLRVNTGHGDLVCSFSSARYRKDTADLKKQLERARRFVAHKNPGQRVKFASVSGGVYAIQGALVKKARQLLGIKGYYTNVPVTILDDQAVITQYGNLWRVEQSFRMSKTDLEARPIFHHQDAAVKSHMLICVMALAAQKHLELATGLSLRRIRDVLKSVTDILLADTVTGRTIIKRSPLSPDAEMLVKKLGFAY